VLREGSEDSKINGEGRTFTPLNIEGGSSHPSSQRLLLPVDYNSFSRPCGQLDIVSQCRRRVFLLSLLQLRRIWCLSKFFNGLYFFRPRGRFYSAS
jgi:hypothetical protein